MIGLNIGVLAEADKPIEKTKRKARRGPYLSLKTVLERFEKAHGDRYDYSKVVLVRVTDPVIIICAKHGQFEQKPDRHHRGDNCPKCSPPGFKNGNKHGKIKAFHFADKEK